MKPKRQVKLKFLDFFLKFFLQVLPVYLWVLSTEKT